MEAFAGEPGHDAGGKCRQQAACGSGRICGPRRSAHRIQPRCV